MSEQNKKLLALAVLAIAFMAGQMLDGPTELQAMEDVAEEVQMLTARADQ